MDLEMEVCNGFPDTTEKQFDEDYDFYKEWDGPRRCQCVVVVVVVLDVFVVVVVVVFVVVVVVIFVVVDVVVVVDGIIVADVVASVAGDKNIVI